MEQIHFLDLILLIGGFLIATALLQVFTRKISFPYTIALLIAGFLAQFLIHIFKLDIHLSLSPDMIFFLLLPVLLFEASLHINIHQFRLQFKTITFLATFGLLLSIFVIAAGLALLTGLPFGIALLFGAIISATDPIAVLALFKTLGAPKRLALLADGESMFNDATAVIAFRAISTFVIANEAFRPVSLLDSTFDLFYVFIGSIVLGVVVGYIASQVFSRMKQDRVLLAALSTGIAVVSFGGAEHFFHVSGVITTVIAGVVVGNFGRTKIPSRTMHFIEEYWEYFGFVSLSLVFFFASFNLDLGLFQKEFGTLLIVIALVLIARAVSVYVSAFISNKWSLFNNEPNIPMQWQHILNWGGLRGVIPLVLVYSLPDDFAYKQLLLQFTFATLLFTLFVNGLTIKKLLTSLRLHLPKKEERIIEDEKSLFEIGEMREKLHALSKKEFNASVISLVDKKLEEQEKNYKDDLFSLLSPEEFHQSLHLEALDIERKTLQRLFEQGRFTETVFHQFDSELDLQQDALEYPEIQTTRVVTKKGMIAKGSSFRKRIINLRRFASHHALLSKLFDITEKSLVRDRYGLVRARLFTSYAAIDYLDHVKKIIVDKNLQKVISQVRETQESYIKKNQNEINGLEKQYPTLATSYQERMINLLITRQDK